MELKKKIETPPDSKDNDEKQNVEKKNIKEIPISNKIMKALIFNWVEICNRLVWRHLSY